MRAAGDCIAVGLPVCGRWKRREDTVLVGCGLCRASVRSTDPAYCISLTHRSKGPCARSRLSGPHSAMPCFAIIMTAASHGAQSGIAGEPTISGIKLSDYNCKQEAKVIWQMLHQMTAAWQTDWQTPRTPVTVVCISCIRCSLKAEFKRQCKDDAHKTAEIILLCHKVLVPLPCYLDKRAHRENTQSEMSLQVWILDERIDIITYNCSFACEFPSPTYTIIVPEFIFVAQIVFFAGGAPKLFSHWLERWHLQQFIYITLFHHKLVDNKKVREKNEKNT